MEIKHKIVIAFGIFINLPIRILRKFPGVRKKILVVREDFLGDTVTWLPFAKLLREEYPSNQYEITHISRKEMIPLLKRVNIADKVQSRLPYSSSIQWLFSRLWFWFTHTCDIMIILFPGVRDQNNKLILTVDDTFQVLSYSKSIVLLFCPPDLNSPKTSFYSLKILLWKKSIYEAYYDIIKFLNIRKEVTTLDWTVGPDDIPYPWINSDYFVVCPGASRSYRCWEEEKFSELIDQLVAKYHYNVVLTGNSSEWEKSDRIRNHCRYKEKIMNTAGELSLIQLFSLVAKARFVVSNETGTAHIGGALGIMTFTICGGGDYGCFIPYPKEIEGKTFFSISQKNHSCFYCRWEIPCTNDKENTCPCIKNITVAQVYGPIIENFGEKKTFRPQL
ncbi:MAG: glycosyltransferase family 9 protein [Lentisphaeria bacterium]|nr:glycosyltransferase family 9 protein [Lentisphaeria bacterium]